MAQETSGQPLLYVMSFVEQWTAVHIPTVSAVPKSFCGPPSTSLFTVLGFSGSKPPTRRLEFDKLDTSPFSVSSHWIVIFTSYCSGLGVFLGLVRWWRSWYIFHSLSTFTIRISANSKDPCCRSRTELWYRGSWGHKSVCLSLINPLQHFTNVREINPHWDNQIDVCLFLTIFADNDLK